MKAEKRMLNSTDDKRPEDSTVLLTLLYVRIDHTTARGCEYSFAGGTSLVQEDSW